MITVKGAIHTKLSSDNGAGGVVTLLGGAFIYYRRPPADATNQFPRVTHGEVTRTEDVDIPRADILYQVDAWGRSSDLNDQICARVRTLLHRGVLAIGDGIVRSVLLQDEREVADPDPDIRHLAQTYRLVITHQ